MVSREEEGIGKKVVEGGELELKNRNNKMG